MSRIVPENPRIWKDGFTYDQTDQARHKHQALYHRLHFKDDTNEDES